MSMMDTIICPNCGKRRQKSPRDGGVYPCPHRECKNIREHLDSLSRPLTVKISIDGESSFKMDLGYGACTDVRFLVGVMLQAGKTLGEELKKHGADPEAVDAAIRRIDILELQEAAQRQE